MCIKLQRTEEPNSRRLWISLVVINLGYWKFRNMNYVRFADWTAESTPSIGSLSFLLEGNNKKIPSELEKLVASQVAKK